MTEKTTRKDLFARIAATMADDEQVVAMCNKYIEQLSRKKVSKPKPEIEDFRRSVRAILEAQTDAVTNKQICELWAANTGDTVSAQKMAAALRWLVANGYAVSYEPETKNGSKTYLPAELPGVEE